MAFPILPFVGATLGAGALSGLGSYFGNKSGRDQAKQFQQYTPEQMQGLQYLSQGLNNQGGPYQDLFSQFDPQQTADAFQKGVANPATRNFNQRVVPGIMERFADQGQNSGLYNSLGQAGREFQSDLDSQLEMFMQQARLQQMQQRMGGLNSLLWANPYQTYIQQGQISPWAAGLSGAGQGLSSAAGMMALSGMNAGNMQSPMSPGGSMDNSSFAPGSNPGGISNYQRLNQAANGPPNPMDQFGYTGQVGRR